MNRVEREGDMTSREKCRAPSGRFSSSRGRGASTESPVGRLFVVVPFDDYAREVSELVEPLNDLLAASHPCGRGKRTAFL